MFILSKKISIIIVVITFILLQCNSNRYGGVMVEAGPIITFSAKFIRKVSEILASPFVKMTKSIDGRSSHYDSIEENLKLTERVDNSDSDSTEEAEVVATGGEAKVDVVQEATEVGVVGDVFTPADAVTSVKVEVPIIDVSALISSSSSLEEKKTVAIAMGKACEEVGFFIITGHGVPGILIEEAWNSTRDFFDLPDTEKLKYKRLQAEYPFGFNDLGQEVLSAGKAAQTGTAGNITPPDLKEMFSLGPSDPQAGFPERIFPTQPTNFEDAWTNYYDTMSDLASKLFVGFALALDLPDPESFFTKFTTHHASALRALNYPYLEDYVAVPGQLRASAHTDYGAFTILRSDSPGLQVSKDKNPPSWHDVPYVKDGFVVNLGDLMQRWTNDQWLSTLHRVVNPVDSADSDTTRRQSIAFFHNLNRDAVVKVLNSDEPKYGPIVAGDFLMQKHLASIPE